MPAGTIALTNNSTAVTGSGTSFTSELKANDFIVTVVGGVTYTLGVQSVNSATSVTLTTAYNGPNASGVAWTALPNGATVSISAQTAADTARAIRGLNLDKANWQQVYSASGNITVNLPDGSQYSGPSWSSVVSSVSGKMDKIQNLNDVADKATARTNLGLKSLALQDQIDRSDLNGELARNLFASGLTPPNSRGAGVWTFNNTPFAYGTQYGTCIQVNNRADTADTAGNLVWQHYLALGTTGEIIYAYNINGVYSARKVYTNGNTTVNSSGALVPASPIVRIVNSRDTAKRSDLLGVNNEEYSWATVRGLCNEESKGCTVSRTGTGEYLIKGAAGLAKDLWTVMDCGNGQGRILALAEATETSDGVVVRCYKQKYTLSEDGDLTVGKGALIDIPDETWIDVRLLMPADSLYNQRHLDVASQISAQTNESDQS